MLRRMREAGLRTRKALGQHFLLDPALLAALVRDAAVAPDDVVLEVGAGLGAFTRALALVARRVVAVELDERLLALAREFSAGHERIAFVQADALAEGRGLSAALREALGSDAADYRIVANLPYRIATALLLGLFEDERHPPRSAHVMVQAEVARRICARPGGKDYGALTVRLGRCAHARVLRAVGRAAFVPPPRVDSAFLELIGRPPDPAREKIPVFVELVNRVFSQRRKTLGAALRGLEPQRREALNTFLRERGFPENVRGERLAGDDFLALAKLLDTP